MLLGVLASKRFSKYLRGDIFYGREQAYFDRHGIGQKGSEGEIRLFLESIARERISLCGEYAGTLEGIGINKVDAATKRDNRVLEWHIDGEDASRTRVTVVFVLYDSNVDVADIRGGNLQYWTAGVDKWQENVDKRRLCKGGRGGGPGTTEELPLPDNTGYCFCGSTVPHKVTPLYIPRELMHVHKRSMFGTEENKPRCVRYSVLVWFKCRTELVDSFRAKFSVEGRAD